MSERRWLVIGKPLEPVAAPPGVAAGYAALLARFGTGTFNDFVRLLPPAHTTSYGQLIGIPGASRDRHIVFAETDNGDSLTWDREAGEASPLFRFAPRSLEPIALVRDADELLELIATRNLVCDDGPAQPFFVPARPRACWSGRTPCPSADVEAAIRRLGAADVLDRGAGEDWWSCTLHVPSCDGIARVQHAGSWWDVRCDAKPGTAALAFAAVLRAFGLEPSLLELRP